MTDATSLIQKALVAISRAGAQSESSRSFRNLVLGAARLARAPSKLSNVIAELSALDEAQAQEAASWLTPSEIAEGNPGPFDASDLRNWLAIASRAGVPAVPAKVILELPATDLEALLGTIDLTTNERTARAARTISRGLSAIALPRPADHSVTSRSDPADIYERCFAAMDEVPSDWMVRTHVCGSGDLKALACCGVAQDEAPEVRFSADLEIGPGWTREGNRRRVTFEDERTLKLYAHDMSVPLAFLARPWVRSSHWYAARDPHRVGTPLDVPGRWPAEWRAFVENGRVVGVSIYYPHVDAADPRSAAKAIEVRDLAQRMVDQARRDGQGPRMMEAAFLASNPERLAVLEASGTANGQHACTLDFIETESGIQFLEGGPACTPFGGGHPCAFMGRTRKLGDLPGQPEIIDTHGVALRNGDAHRLRSPYGAGEIDAVILGWPDAQNLAAS